MKPPCKSSAGIQATRRAEVLEVSIIKQVQRNLCGRASFHFPFILKRRVIFKLHNFTRFFPFFFLITGLYMYLVRVPNKVGRSRCGSSMLILLCNNSRTTVTLCSCTAPSFSSSCSPFRALSKEHLASP